jgi:hypothetical protein
MTLSVLFLNIIELILSLDCNVTLIRSFWNW